MSRRRGAKPSSGIQLFPFLAVLICTMGALVVLLHAFAQRGRSAALKEAETAAIAQAEGDKNELEDTQWRIAQLAESREKTAEQLNDERLKLSHVEDHERRLAEKLNQLKIAVEEMDRQSAQTSEQGQRYQAELEAAKEKLDQARRDVEGLKQQGKFRSVNYSVVPYDGPNSTNRQPIYIECRDSLIILQPEGIELLPQDFIGFFGPGNPLASALRAKREYYARQAPSGTLPLEPYPLLLVRPEGIQAYYAARAALDSWGSDFGYEMIGADWNLSFPPADPQLTTLTSQVVGEARLRHREYIMTSPQVAKSRPRKQYHARAQGGFAPSGGGGSGGSGKGSWEDFAGEWARANGSGAGGPDGRGGLEEGSPGKGGTGSESSGSYGGQSAGGGAFGPGGTNPDGSRPGDAGSNHSGPGTGGKRPGAGFSGEAADGDGLTDTRDGSKTGGATQREYGSGKPGTGEQEYGEAGSPGQYANGSPSSRSGQQPGSRSSSKPGGTGGSNSANGSQGGPASDSGGAAAGQASSDSQSSSPKLPGDIKLGSSGSPHQAQGPANRRMQSMAGQRGKDWGLPEGASRATPAIRPVLVECHADRLVVVSNDRLHPSKEIKLSERTQDSMDDLISAVWEHTKSWGTAGKGVIWRPTLAMDIKPGAADRYADIKSLLADSGLEVHERVPPPTTVKQPTKKSPRR